MTKISNLYSLTNYITADSVGKIGIGTATPSVALDVVSAIRATNTATSGFASANVQLAAYNGSAVAVGGSIFQTNSTFAYQQILANQTNIYGNAANGMRLATANAPIVFSTGNSDADFSTTRMIITSGGNLGLGTSSPTDYSGFTTLHVNGKSGTSGGLLRLTAFDGSSGVNIYAGAGTILFNSTSAVPFVFLTQDAERMRITSGGNVGIGSSGSLTGVGKTLTVEGTGIFQTGAGGGSYNENLRLNRTGNGYSAVALGGAYGTSQGTGAGQWTFVATPSNLSYQLDFDYAGTTAVRFATSGTVTNLTGVYGVISDIKFKENIVDATPKLTDLMNLKVRNYNLIGDSTKQIGFIAQELEEVFPGMIEEAIERKEDGEIGESYKSIKTSVLIPMLVKAIQELSAKVTALENK